MKSGELRHRVTVERSAIVEDTAGPREVWSSVGTYKAAIDALTVNEIFRAEQQHASATHRIRFRFRPELAALKGSERVIEGERIFVLVGLPINVNNERNREVDLLCLEGLGDEGPPPVPAPVQHHVSSGGSDANPGTPAEPFATLQQAHDAASPGDTIFLRGGTYAIDDAGIVFTKSGTSDAPITVTNYPGEVPIFDGAGMTTANHSGLEISGAFWRIKGLVIKNAPFCGILLTGTAHDNTIEQCELDHNVRINASGAGIQIGSTVGANNVIANNDCHHSGVIGSSGGDGIGNSSTALGNVIRGNRVWRNNDDGIDLWGAQNTLVERNWVWENGKKDDLTPTGGNGNGFKLGGGVPPNGMHTIRNNLSWRNQEHGFTDNSANLPMDVFNNTAWDNGNRNFAFYTEVAYVLKNNLSYPKTLNYLPASAPIQVNNAWQLSVTITDADFLSLDYSGATGARGSDGSLPAINFLKLAGDSDLIDQGVNVGLPYNGAAPDLGAYET